MFGRTHLSIYEHQHNIERCTYCACNRRTSHLLPPRCDGVQRGVRTQRTQTKPHGWCGVGGEARLPLSRESNVLIGTRNAKYVSVAILYGVLREAPLSLKQVEYMLWAFEMFDCYYSLSIWRICYYHFIPQTMW